MNVASLFATLGLKLDGKSFDAATAALMRMRKSAEALDNALKKTNASFSMTGAKREALANAAFNSARFDNAAKADLAASRRYRAATIEERIANMEESTLLKQSRTRKRALADQQHFDRVTGAPRGRSSDEPAMSWEGYTPSSAGRAHSGPDGRFARLGRRIRSINDGISAGIHHGVSHVLRGAALVYVGAKAVKTVTGLADAYNNASNRLKVLTKDTAQQKRLQDLLFASAQRTGTSYDDATALYQQIGKALNEQKVPLEQGVKITELISMAVKASGANAVSASKALYQLSQAIGSNRLSGDEFRSVIEGAPILIDLFGKALGKNRSEMRKMAEEQKISTKIMLRGILEGEGAIREMYGNKIPTLGEAFVRLRERISRAFGEMFQKKENIKSFNDLMALAETGVTKLFGAFEYLMQHKDQVIKAVKLITMAFVAMKFAALAAWLASLGPAGWVAAGIGGIAAAIALFRKSDDEAALRTDAAPVTKNVTFGPTTINVDAAGGDPVKIQQTVEEHWRRQMIIAGDSL